MACNRMRGSCRFRNHHMVFGSDSFRNPHMVFRSDYNRRHIPRTWVVRSHTRIGEVDRNILGYTHTEIDFKQITTLNSDWKKIKLTIKKAFTLGFG